MKMSFNLFRNTNKDGTPVENPQAPVYRNNKVVFKDDMHIKAGQEYNVALWKVKESKAGNPIDMLSISLSDPDPKYQNKQSEPETKPEEINNIKDDIPW